MSWDSPPLVLKRRAAGAPALVYRIFRPEGPAEIAVLMTFGYCEHMGRYREVIERWNQRGVLAAIYDTRGHGQSEGRRGRVMHFDEYVDDAFEMLAELDRDDAWRRLGRPVLFGHSMGGLISIHTALRAQQRFAGLALSSPYLGVAVAVPALKLAVGRLLSRFVPTVSLATGVRGVDVTRSPDIAEAYDRDPMNFKKANVRWFTESVAAQERAIERAPEKMAGPIFCLYGGGDKIALPDATDRFMERVKSADRQSRRLPGVYHEVLNEPERGPWIDEFATAMLRFRADRAETQTERAP